MSRARARRRCARPWVGLLAWIAISAAAGWVALLVTAPDACADAGVTIAQAGNDVGRNLGGLLRRWGGQIYGGIVAIVSLVFLLNRRYSELAMFLLAAVLVAWMVFSPDQIARAARGIGRQILG